MTRRVVPMAVAFGGPGTHDNPPPPSGPERVADYDTDWTASSSPKASPSFDTLAGDLIVVRATMDSGPTTDQVTVSDNKGLTWTQHQLISVNSYACTAIWTAPAGAQTGLVVSIGCTVTTKQFGGNVAHMRGFTGTGASAGTNGVGAPTINVTTGTADAWLAVIVGDWNTTSRGGGATYPAVNGAQPTVLQVANGSNILGEVFDYADVGAAGSKTVGEATPTGQKYSIAVVELVP